MAHLRLLLLALAVCVTVCSAIYIQRRSDYVVIGGGATLLGTLTTAACKVKLPIPPQYQAAPCLVALGVDLIVGVVLTITGAFIKRDFALQYGYLEDVHPAFYGGKESLKAVFSSAQRSPSEPILLAHHVGDSPDELSHWLYAYNPSTRQHSMSAAAGNYTTSMHSKRQDTMEDNSKQNYVQYTWDDDDADADHHAHDDEDAVRAAYYSKYNTQKFTGNYFNTCMGLKVNGKMATAGALCATHGEHQFTEPGQDAGAAGNCNNMLKGK